MLINLPIYLPKQIKLFCQISCSELPISSFRLLIDEIGVNSVIEMTDKIVWYWLVEYKYLSQKGFEITFLYAKKTSSMVMRIISYHHILQYAKWNTTQDRINCFLKD